MKLVNPTDEQLNEAFSIHVAKLPHEETEHVDIDSRTVSVYPPMQWTESIYGVMKYLDQRREAVYINRYPGWGDPMWKIRVYENDEDGHLLAETESWTLSHAIVVCLLRLNGVPVTFEAPF